MITFPEAVSLGFKRYVDFQGRSTRPEYWWWALFYFSGSVIFAGVDTITGIGMLQLLFFLGVLIPNITVGVRRLHDTGRSGWWILAMVAGFFVFVIPGLMLLGVLIYWWCQPSDEEVNRYGHPSPHVNQLYGQTDYDQTVQSLGYCGACGSKLEDNAKICRTCGTPVSKT